jgi:acetyltransferase-like isoleucine patch superfamily enzyme
MNFNCKVCSANQNIGLLKLVKAVVQTILLRKKPPSMRDRFAVGRGTYGEPTIAHWGEPATLKIGSFCSIAGEVTIFLGGNHRIDWITTYPFPEFRERAKGTPDFRITKGDVIIGNDVWIGNGASIMSGVQIGNGAVIGTSSVVTKNVPPYGIVAGNPARLIRFRFAPGEIAMLEKLAWWDWPDAMIDAAMPVLLSGNIPALNEFATSHLPPAGSGKPI